MKISISLASESDSALLADMSRHLIEDGLPWTWTSSRVLRCVRNPECTVIVARDDRRTAGFAIMEFHDVHAHLSLLAVRCGYRRRGVGRRMVEWLESSARVAGTFLIRLELRSTNEQAKAFYRELGYREMGVSPKYYAGREDALRMTRDLTVVSA